MRLRIETNSPVPPFEQIRAQISLMVAAGRQKPGDRLPTIRELARELDVANGTIARAYRELEYAGILVKRGRAGTFVSPEPPVAFEIVDRRERLESAAARFALEAEHLGVEPTEAIEAVTAAVRLVGLEDVAQKGAVSEK